MDAKFWTKRLSDGFRDTLAEQHTSWLRTVLRLPLLTPNSANHVLYARVVAIVQGYRNVTHIPVDMFIDPYHMVNAKMFKLYLTHRQMIMLNRLAYELNERAVYRARFE